MHEMSIMSSLFRILQEKAKEQKAKRILAITIRVGALAGVEPDLLTFAFEAFAQGTNAEGAKFIVNKSEMIGRCRSCRNEKFEFDRFVLTCPRCESLDVEVLGGDELLVERMEVEIDED